MTTLQKTIFYPAAITTWALAMIACRHYNQHAQQHPTDHQPQTDHARRP